jgi:hypothetical protein
MLEATTDLYSAEPGSVPYRILKSQSDPFRSNIRTPIKSSDKDNRALYFYSLPNCSDFPNYTIRLGTR